MTLRLMENEEGRISRWGRPALGGSGGWWAVPQVKPRMVNLETEEAADPTGGLALFFPIIDGDLIPAMPLKSVQQGAGAGYDLLLGYNTDEVNAFLVPTGLLKKIKFDFLLNKAVRRVHPAPRAVVATYRQAYPQKTRGELLSAIVTAYQFQVPSIRYADAHAQRAGKTYLYEFGWPSSVAGGSYGAYHGLALPFVFNQRALTTDPQGMLGPAGAPAELADKIQDAWIAFARTGSPGWAAYTAGERQAIRLDTTWQLQANPHAKELQAWDGVR